MEVYKAVRDNVAIFLNPDKFDEFISDGYIIYRVHDLENEKLDEKISEEDIKSLKKEDGKKSFTIKKEGEEFDNKEYKS